MAQAKNFVMIKNGNSKMYVLPENIAKVEAKLAKVKPPKWGQAFTKSRDFTRVFPQYKSGMSTAEYVNQYEKANRMGVPTNSNIRHGHGITGLYSGLNENPAAEYDSTSPLCIVDDNPDYIPENFVKFERPKKTRRDIKGERIAALEVAVKYLLNNATYPENVQIAQIRKLVDFK